MIFYFFHKRNRTFPFESTVLNSLADSVYVCFVLLGALSIHENVIYVPYCKSQPIKHGVNDLLEDSWCDFGNRSNLYKPLMGIYT